MTQQSTNSHISVTLLSAALGLIIVSGLVLLLPIFASIYIEPTFGSAALTLIGTFLLFIASAVTAFLPKIAHNRPNKKLMVLNMVLTILVTVVLGLLTWIALIVSALGGGANSTGDMVTVVVISLLLLCFVISLQLRHVVLLKHWKAATK